jgi:hypothetical protein
VRWNGESNGRLGSLDIVRNDAMSRMGVLGLRLVVFTGKPVIMGLLKRPARTMRELAHVVEARRLLMVRRGGCRGLGAGGGEMGLGMIWSRGVIGGIS